jgi:hypothetical protein
MRGKLKGERDRLIALAHQVEAMARQKILRPLAKYLEEPKKQTPDQGARKVLAMMKRLKEKQNGAR